MAGGFFGGGTGTSADPFMIEDGYDLSAIRVRGNISTSYQLANNINLNVPPFNQGRGWSPIPYFIGSINGNGYKIYGLRSISSGKDDVGLILSSSTSTYFYNLHFEDFYLEMDTELSDPKVFTLLGIDRSDNVSGLYSNIRGCSFVGKVRLTAPNMNLSRKSGLLGVNYNRTSTSTGQVATRDCYIDIENTGETTFSLFGEFSGQSTGSIFQYILERVLIKSRGKVTSHTVSGFGNMYFNYSSHGSSDRYLITEEGTDYSQFNIQPNRTDIGRVPAVFLSNINNVENFMESSHFGRQAWFLPKNAHIRMEDRTEEKFLIEADGKLYTYESGLSLREVSVSPVTTGKLINYGMDLIESVPPSAWDQLREASDVEIHCYAKKYPAKTSVIGNEALAYSQAVDDKAIMRSKIVFSEHNDDIVNISITEEV